MKIAVKETALYQLNLKAINIIEQINEDFAQMMLQQLDLLLSNNALDEWCHIEDAEFLHNFVIHDLFEHTLAANLFGMQLDFNLPEEDPHVGATEALAVELGCNWVDGNALDNDWISNELKEAASAYIDMGMHVEYKALQQALVNAL